MSHVLEIVVVNLVEHEGMMRQILDDAWGEHVDQRIV